MIIFDYYIIFINIMGFIICFVDKKKAINHKFRISEKVLLIFIFMGGCFGFALSMLIFHHKTRKLKFIISIILSIFIWILLIRFLLNNNL